MKLRWLINRLKLMSAGEVYYRFKQLVSSRVEKRRLEYGWEPRIDHAVSTRLAIIDPDRMVNFPEPKTLSAASGLRAGKLALFDYGELSTGWPVNWHRDPLTGTTSPADQFGKSIDYRSDETVGDIKVLWELGRQQFLVPIAIEYNLSRKEENLAVLSGVINSWLAQNPYGYGVHWCSSLEVAIRGLSWCVTHQVLLASGQPQGIFSLDIDVSELKKQLYQHAAFIRGHLSLYSSANNHLIGELTGLYAICSLFEFGEKSDRWREFAWRSLLLEFNRQVYSDGVNKEQAIYYHCWVLEYFLINYLIASHSGEEIPADYLKQLSKMAQFVCDLSPSSLFPPQIGDADDGVAIQFSAKPSPFHLDLIETINVLAGVLSVDLARIKPFYYHLFLKAGSPSPAPVVQTSYPVSYPEGGYAILGKPSFHAVFDCGDLGYPAIAAHGHADILNVCLAIDGVWWLVDPGTYSYHSDHDWRNYFRGSPGHNVLSINKKDQSVIGGPFMWISHANPHFLGITCDAEIQSVAGWHDGYASEGASRTGRSVQVNTATEQIFIHDEVECSREIQVDLHYHFSPDVHCVKQQGSTILLEKKGTDTRIQLEFPDQFTVKRYHGSIEPLLGWFSSNLGKKEPCLTVRASAILTSTSRFTTNLAVIREREE